MVETASHEMLDIPTPPPKAKFENFSKWIETEDVSFRRASVDFDAAIEFTNFEQINWQLLDKISYLSGGAGEGDSNGGVLVLQFLSSSSKKACVVLKPSKSIASELFASFLIQQLQIPTPQVQLIEWRPKNREKDANREYKLIKKKCLEITDQNPVKQLRIGKLLKRPFFLLQEYIPYSKSLEDVSQITSTSEMKFVWEQVLLKEDHLQSIWKTLGQIIVADVLLNNFDRIPVVWDNNGNAGNVFFQLHNKIRTVAIDQVCCRIQDEALRQQYVSRVKEFALAMKNHGKENNSFLETIVKFLKHYAPKDYHSHFDGKIKEQIYDGIMEMINYCKVLVTSQETIAAWKEQIEMMKTGNDMEGIYEYSLKDIDASFVFEISRQFL